VLQVNEGGMRAQSRKFFCLLSVTKKWHLWFFCTAFYLCDIDILHHCVGMGCLSWILAIEFMNPTVKFMWQTSSWKLSVVILGLVNEPVIKWFIHVTVLFS
jgi:hypothetical protein